MLTVIHGLGAAFHEDGGFALPWKSDPFLQGLSRQLLAFSYTFLACVVSCSQGDQHKLPSGTQKIQPVSTARFQSMTSHHSLRSGVWDVSLLKLTVSNLWSSLSASWWQLQKIHNSTSPRQDIMVCIRWGGQGGKGELNTASAMLMCPS